MKNCTQVLKAILCTLLIAAGLPTISLAQMQMQRAEKNLTVSNGDYLGFLEYKPADYDTEGNVKHPLIIFLHGIGERGNGKSELWKAGREGLPRMINAGHPMRFTWNGKTETFLVIAPQCPVNAGMWPQLYITELINYAKQNLRVDPNRIFLTGLSMGAGGSFRYISTAAAAPTTIAAVATICPPCTFDNGKFVADAKLPFWTFHAADDAVTPVSCSDRAVQRILDANPAVKPLKTTWPTGGHIVWDRVYADTNYRFDGTINIYEWFLGQNKSLPANKLPVAKATGTTSITTSQGVARLSGSSSTDADGKIVRYVWKQLSGPANGVIVNRFGPQASTDITGLTTSGTYRYELSVVDDRAGFTRDTISVTVSSAAALPNKAPVANAGNDVTITLPTNKVTLNGTTSKDEDGKIVTFQWSRVSGPGSVNIANQYASVTEISNLTEGTHIVKLKVTDDKGATAEHAITIKVNPAPNKLPVAHAGNNITINLPTNKAQLNGSASKDDDGTIVSYAWTKVSGPSAFNISNATNAITEVTNLSEGTYIFQLTVTDNRGGKSSAEVTVKVNPAPLPPNKLPSANAGKNITITLPVNKVRLDGTASYDEDGSIASYAWSKISGPAQFIVASASTAVTEVTNLGEGTYVFRLRVTDNRGGIADANVTITVKPAPPPPNIAPVALAGPDRVLSLPHNEVVIDGGYSFDPDGRITSFQWTKISGPDVFEISNIYASMPTLRGLIEGTYHFRLQVRDNDGATSADTVIVKVNPASVPPPAPNAAPVAKVTPKTAQLQLPVNSITLNASGSYDPDGSVVEYIWSKISGPASHAISSRNGSSTSVEQLIAGKYAFSVTIKDDKGALASDTMTVTVLAADNLAPVADAGVDIEVSLPDPAIRLNALGSYDPDGSIVRYSWIQVTGKGGVSITNSNTTTPGVHGVTAGEYIFQLTIVDNDGASAIDYVKLTVLPATEKEPADSTGDENLRYEETIQVYPNPAVYTINVNLTSDYKGNAKIAIYDVTGNKLQTVETEKTHARLTHRVNISRLHTGLYYLEVIEGSQRRIVKFVKK